MLHRMTLKKKIALLLTSSVLIVALAAWGVVYRAQRNELIEDNRAMLSRYAAAMAKAGEQRGVEGIKEMSRFWIDVYPKGRFSLINTMGEVVFDSLPTVVAPENHYKRPEVMKAFADGEGYALRYSKTVGAWQSYVARRVIIPGSPGEGMVIRLSYPVEGLAGLVRSMGRPFLYSIEIVLVLVWLGAYWVLRQIMRPLNALSRAAEDIAAGKAARFPICDDEEMQNLANALNSMSDSLKLSAKEAAEREEELAVLVGALPVGVILIDDKRKIRYINREAAVLCGRGSFMPSRGASVELVLPSEEIARMLDEEDGRRLFTLSRNSLRKIEVTTLTITRGRLIVMQDMTEKMRLEEARRDFFIDAGHEFQTPLSVIRTGLELLKSGGGLKDMDDINTVDSMIRQQERISGLVDDLLFLVRLDVDPFVADYEEINLNSLAASLLSDVKDLPKSRGISFDVISADVPAAVRGRYADLKRALFNLLENAVKYVASYREAGSGKIMLSVRDAGDFWEICVDDNGPGIPDEEKEIIFERFRRGERHRARSGGMSGGYGLGLSISRRIAERHGGSLNLADSKLGGAAFVMTLPKA